MLFLKETVVLTTKNLLDLATARSEWVFSIIYKTALNWKLNTASNRLLNFFPHRLTKHPGVTTSLAGIWPHSRNGFTLDISSLLYHLVAMKAFQGFGHFLSPEILCKNLLMQLCKSVSSLVSWPLQQYLPLQDLIYWFCWHWS